MTSTTPQSRLLALGDGRPTIEVLEAGQGTPLLFLHGAGGIPLWEGALPLLARSFRVHAPLLPGFGRSTGLEHLDDQLDLVLHAFDVLEALGLERPVVLGDGGAATAFVQALPHARRFSRRAEWPPVVAGADLVVNATAEREEVLVELDPGQVLVDLPYPETATAGAARRAGARVVGGLEVLVAQGAASLELWTGAPAPVEAMQAALGLPP